MVFRKKSKNGLRAVSLTAFLLSSVFLSAPIATLWAPSAVFAQSLFARAPAEGFADLVDKVMPAVVSVDARSEGDKEQSAMTPNPFMDLPKDSPFRQFFENFPPGRFGKPFGRRSPKSLSQGSGFFISSDGYVVTNYHVIKGADEVTVHTSDEKDHKAKVVGVDPKTDLALLKISEDKSFSFVTFSSKEPRVGDWVVAVGNPFGLGGTVTTGIVSARGRDIGSGPYDDFIQIDAPINRGNSGGPAFNLDGEVIGINTAIYSPSGGSVGIGFAIPAREAIHVIEALKQKGKVTRGWLGVQIQPVTQDIADGAGLKQAKGALIADITPRSPALLAGLKPGDVVLELNGEEIKDSSDLARRIAQIDPGSKVMLKLARTGKNLDISVKLGVMPSEKEMDSFRQSPVETSSKLGLAFENTPDRSGVLITAVEEGSEAEMRGVKVGDVILRVGGIEVEDAASLNLLLDKARKAGSKAVLLLLRSAEGQRFVALPFEEK